MRKTLVALAFAAALLPVTASHAQSFSTLEERMSAADFQRAGLDKLSAEELAALNAWLQQDTARRAAAAPARDTRGMRNDASPADEADIVSRLPGPFTGWTGNETFRLENGQVWRAVDTSTPLVGVRLESPQVTIRKGLFGTWRLKVEGYNTSVKVQRVE